MYKGIAATMDIVRAMKMSRKADNNRTAYIVIKTSFCYKLISIYDIK